MVYNKVIISISIYLDDRYKIPLSHLAFKSSLSDGRSTVALLDKYHHHKMPRKTVISRFHPPDSCDL